MANGKRHLEHTLFITYETFSSAATSAPPEGEFAFTVHGKAFVGPTNANSPRKASIDANSPRKAFVGPTNANSPGKVFAEAEDAKSSTKVPANAEPSLIVFGYKRLSNVPAGKRFQIQLSYSTLAIDWLSHMSSIVMMTLTPVERVLAELAISHIVVRHLRVCMGKGFAKNHLPLILSYVCDDNNNKNNDLACCDTVGKGGGGSPILHRFAVPFVECTAHAYNLDHIYEWNGWKAVETNIDPSMFTASTRNTRILAASSALAAQTRALKAKRAAAVRDLYQLNYEIDVKRAELVSVQRAHETAIASQATAMTSQATIFGAPTLNRLPSDLIKQHPWDWSEWVYESCECCYHSNVVQPQCWKRCSPSLTQALNKFSKDIATTGVRLTIGKTRYGYVSDTKFEKGEVAQENTTTSRVRYLRRVHPLVHAADYFASPDYIDKIVGMVRSAPHEGVRSCAQKLGDVDRRVWFLYAHNYMAHDCGSSPSLVNWLRQERKVTEAPTLKFEKLEFVENARLAEEFLLRLRWTKDKTVLIGFHGTRSADPLEIATTGLDPRFSSDRNFLGRGSYLSFCGTYVHRNNYAKTAGMSVNVVDGRKIKTTFYQVVVALFIPGRPCYVFAPNRRRHRTCHEASQKVSIPRRQSSTMPAPGASTTATNPILGPF